METPSEWTPSELQSGSSLTLSLQDGLYPLPLATAKAVKLNLRPLDKPIPWATSLDNRILFCLSKHSFQYN